MFEICIKDITKAKASLDVGVHRRALKRLRPIPGNKKRAASKALDSKARAPKNTRPRMKWELDEPEPPETKDAQNDVPQPSEENSKELFDRLTEYVSSSKGCGYIC